jgi:hypothetical protein
MYVILCKDYVQVSENHLSSHAFLCARIFGFGGKKNILDKS